MARKKVFISFDYDYDRHYRYLLSALKENSSSELEFEDVTPEEIQSSDISRIKAVLTRKIKDATHTLVIIGAHANSYHPDRAEIGERNWQWWEIKRSQEEGNKMVAVKIDKTNPTPEPLYNSNVSWAYSFKVASIIEAIENA